MYPQPSLGQDMLTINGTTFSCTDSRIMERTYFLSLPTKLGSLGSGGSAVFELLEDSSAEFTNSHKSSHSRIV
uniref:Uncharacterized protein n=1 Tax=Physcomitrium patens TaxID=3218 RepID=A0A2K1K9Y5_PHYPA|nr:hypothetical protein PHYPA_009767 [Physcomitrium patens]